MIKRSYVHPDVKWSLGVVLALGPWVVESGGQQIRDILGAQAKATYGFRNLRKTLQDGFDPSFSV